MTFRFTGSEMKSIGAMALASLVVGALYKTVDVTVRQCTDRVELDPAPEALQNRPTLFNYFVQLSEVRSVDEVSFRAALVESDRMVHLWNQMRLNRIQGTSFDVAEGLTNHTVCLENIERLYQAAARQKQVRYAASIRSLKKKIKAESLSVIKAMQDMVHSSL